MLVLSRRLNQKILFPSQDISVEVIQTKGPVVRLGIEAPPGIRILREELAGKKETVETTTTEIDVHQVRNELHKLGLGLQLMKRQLEAGRATEARVTFERMEKSLDAAQRSLETEVRRELRERPVVV